MLSKEELFQSYKKDLSKENLRGEIRYNVIQYLCHFPKIDPDEMAASLIKDGHNVVFDDSSISQKENNIIKNRVASIVKQ